MIFNLNNYIIFNFYKLNICLLIFFFYIFCFLFCFIIICITFHRKKIKILNFRFSNNNILELLWILTPLLLLFYLSKYCTFILIKSKYLYKSDITIKIIAYQWRWYYRYLNNYKKNINYFSDINTSIFEIFNFKIKNFNYLLNVNNKLILPINKIIRLIVTSNDVVHSWNIPVLNLKQDAIPGFLREIYFNFKNLGIYKGFCTELCGRNHAYMPIIIKVISFNNYKKWILSKYIENFLKIKFN